VGGQQRQEAQLGSGQGRGSQGGRTAGLGELGPQILGLPGEDTQAGAAPEYLVDLPHERPRACQVAEREVDPGELGPGLNGEVRDGIAPQQLKHLLCRRRRGSIPAMPWAVTRTSDGGAVDRHGSGRRPARSWPGKGRWPDNHWRRGAGPGLLDTAPLICFI